MTTRTRDRSSALPEESVHITSSYTTTRPHHLPTCCADLVMEFATGALGALLPKLGQLLKDEYNLHKGAKKNIKLLTSELRSIQAALRSVGEVPPEQLSELVRIWARDARELSYDMEDIVDAFLVRVQGPEPPGKKTSKRFINKMMDFVTKTKTRHEIGQEIKDIKERVKEVAERRDRYKVDAITPARTCLVDPRIASLYAKAADLVGVDGSVEELITRLTKGDVMSVQQQRIVSVVGFGGLGKTTLAKVVKDKLKGQFNCTAFVPVGRNPDLKKVLKDILIDLDKQRYMHFNFAILDERQLIDELRSFLGNKKYFIVIDDVWDTYSWGTVKLGLVENNNGSRIIITTRTHEVANEAGEVYKLQPLSYDNSRKLFFARIFGGERKSSDHQQDDEVSDKILRKCDGIPLAIITMASLLVGKPREEWSEVHRSIGLVRSKENRQVENTTKIISFSYYDLPPHLRACLLHLSMFPEDYFIEKGPLIWMWIAEGFVHERQGVSSFEIGEGYFNELVNRSMIQLVEKGQGDWMVCGCQVHDMVLDLIRSISSEENFVTILDNKNEGASSSSQGKARRLALQNNRTIEAHMEDTKQVRSFILCGLGIDMGVALSSFKHIRVLAIIDYNFQRVVERCHLNHLGNLVHLRYLQLVGGGSIKLPEEFGTLKFLQTLDLHCYYKDEEVATSVCLLTQLQCLRLRGWFTKIPDGIGKLTSLEELQIYSRLRERNEGEEPFRRFVKELGSLRKLRVLRIGMPFLSSDVIRAVEMEMVESLRNLQKMEHLSLSASNRLSADAAAWEAAGFLPTRHLGRLILVRISFSRLPSMCINPSRLPNLSHLYLEVDAIDEQDLRILGGLPQLCDLHLSIKSTLLEVACSSGAAADGDGCLFKKLRRFILCYAEVQLLLSKDDTLSFRVPYLIASVLLGSEWEGICSGKSLVLTLMSRIQKLEFTVVSVRELEDENHRGSLSLEHFASLQNVTVDIDCDGATAAEVDQVEAALRRAGHAHPNNPTLEVTRPEIESDEDQEDESDTPEEDC